MNALKYKVNVRVCLCACILILVCLLTIPVYAVWTYHLDGHKWFYSRGILDLPKRINAYFRTRDVNYDGWTKGSPNWLVDPVELHSKFPKNVTSHGHHEILYFNERPASRLNLENKLLEACPYTNCHITDRRERMAESSAVIYEISHHVMGRPPGSKPSGQVWIFQDFEPPLINGLFDHRRREWDGKLNWSMSFRYDSDIIRNYGYLKTRLPDRIPKVDYHEVFTRKKKFAAWFVSNCGSNSMSSRSQYINELRKYVNIDVYGKCGTMMANRTTAAVSNLLKDYKFFISFENSFCVDYVTEKFFEYFRNTDAVLVVRGGAEYDKLLPEYTHINAQHYSNARDLATYLLALSEDESEYVKYLKTRDRYESAQMNWACNLCVKLNNKDSYARVYDDLVRWWHTGKCWAATDVTVTWTAKRRWALLTFALICCAVAVYVYVIKPSNRNSARSSVQDNV